MLLAGDNRQHPRNLNSGPQALCAKSDDTGDGKKNGEVSVIIVKLRFN
jgi:hypothetical protein